MVGRDIIKIAVEHSAKQSIDEACRRYGMSQIELASRVYRWFAEQDETIQAAILDILPEDVAPDIARLLLERLAEESSEDQPSSDHAASKAKPDVHVTRRRPPDPRRRR